MATVTAWHWVLWAAAVVAVAVISRRTFRAVARAAIRVRDDGRRPLTRRERVLLRFQDLGFHPLFFAWCKFRRDAMFDELPDLLRDVPALHTFLDLGCGLGVAGSFLLELFPASEVYAIDPSAERVAVAKRALGARGHVFEGAAPDFKRPGLPDRLDAAFSIDVLHYLNDEALSLTLSRVRGRLDDGGYLVIRAPMRPVGRGSLVWKLTRVHQRAWGLFAQYRTVEELRGWIEGAGFKVLRSQISGKNPELHWFVSTAVPLEQEVERLVLEPVPAVGDDGEQHHR